MTTQPRVSARRCSIRRSSSARSATRSRKLDPRRMIKNPVMFVVEIGSIFTTLLFVHALVTGAGDASAGFIGAVSLWLWFTVLFANFAEAMAEGRGKAQADSLRKARGCHRPPCSSSRARRAAPSEPSSQLARRRPRARRGGPGDPRRRRDRRGRRIGGRERDHGRERAGDPRERRRSQRGHRWHAVLSDWLVIKITTDAGRDASSIA